MAQTPRKIEFDLTPQMKILARAEAARLSAESAVKLAYVSVAASVVSLIMSIAAVTR